MDFAPSEDETLIRETATSFATKALRSHERAHEAGSLEPTVVSSFADTGLGLLWAPDDAEMEALGPLARCLAIEALAAGDAGATLGLLGAAWAGHAAALLGVLEGDRADLGHVHQVDSLEATPEAVAWLPIRDGHPLLLVDRAGAWRVVETSCEPIKALGLLGAGASKCTLGREVASGSADHGAAAEVRAHLAKTAGALLVGISDASLAYAKKYVQGRRAFGKTLSQHQGLAFIVAEMAMGLEAARLLLHASAMPGASPASASHAYLECLDAALHVTSYGVQLLGGHGYMLDHPVEKWMRDARAVGLLWGGRDSAAQDAAADAWEGTWT